VKLYLLAKLAGEKYELRGVVREELVAEAWYASGKTVFEVDIGFGLLKGLEITLRKWEAKR